ncbi:MAG: alpha-amylase [Proteobacteria bacterium]|nr:MAG: alpha-amylase [Pseudomonadota bacterium]
MPSVCFYFQVHQPFRIKRYSYFEGARQHDYFDSERNSQIMCKVAEKCYLPTNSTLLRLIERYQGKFKISFSITGTAIEQMSKYSPQALHSFVELAKTGCVEFLGETYYHSLASLYDQEEFKAQVRLHTSLVEELFGQTPQIFRNTELIYQDFIGQLAAQIGFKGVIAEGADDVLGWRSPNFLYSVPQTETALMLKNYRLSDDVAFRFSNRSWNDFPLTADKFAGWVHQVSGNGDVVNLFMDYETFGEHQWESTGIFSFLDYLPEMILRHPDWDFVTPSESCRRYARRAELHFPRLTSWADLERDITAWRGNRMQHSSLEKIYALGKRLSADSTANGEALSVWRKLLTSDHFYYMCTKWFADGDVHAYFSPFESPYEAFISYMNVLRDFENFYLGSSKAASEHVVT